MHTLEIITVAVATLSIFLLGFSFGRNYTLKDEGIPRTTQVKPPKELLKPFVKKSGKHPPRVNDDREAWIKENDPRL